MPLSAEENYRLLCEIEANRAMLLQAYLQNDHLWIHLDERIRRIFNPDHPDPRTSHPASPHLPPEDSGKPAC
ncbi:MAG: hypothetical protein KBD60_00775 [Sterolibacterium sp.]|jgi:hypothetical protein|nr:hypothetical protein [Sterolibacterium sp.]